ncbi:inner centromere protein [Drechmeria coniospora]|uniref:Inner centromere protein n=1 Tax=Drechmeria coniospora TaxID=98403 RepID=A0A151GQF6_DRECN|nr:inner centromere protein [Drechmeria coniospora]KYK59298.1 inner centromere protein [Drechmeria coniospora]
MAAMRGPRLQVGSAAWIAEERSSALQIVQSEVEEFSFSARNELEWLNEHMASIFDENETNIAETFKTPGKLRGKTPRTVRRNPDESRVPLSDVFAPTLNGTTNATGYTSYAQSRTLPSTVPPTIARKPVPSERHPVTHDSGYFGSQEVAPMNIHLDSDFSDTQDMRNDANWRAVTNVPTRDSPVRSPKKTSQMAREEVKTRILDEAATNSTESSAQAHAEGPEEEVDVIFTSTPAAVNTVARPEAIQPQPQASESNVDQHMEEAQSPSDLSSPVRTMVRKSSLNFASLPAREPLAAGKSTGARASRTSHLDHIRTSYYSRPTGEKSLGSLAKPENGESGNADKMDVDEEIPAEQNSLVTSHTKTYTQRLQDQINMLGKSQPTNTSQLKPVSIASASQQPKTPAFQSPSHVQRPAVQTTPGAFPVDDDDDDWIEPPATVGGHSEARRGLPKSYSADVMEDIQGKDTIGGDDFCERPAQHPYSLGLSKSVSVLTVPTMHSAVDPDLQLAPRAISVSNPTLVTQSEMPQIRSESPSRPFRESPLKQVKNKLSSILKMKSARGVVPTEGKLMMSPSVKRSGVQQDAPSASALSQAPHSHGLTGPASPTKPVARRTRASVEKEKEEKRREKEAKRAEEQNDKLERVREKEREKAHIFVQEQEKIAEMEQQVASKKNGEKPVIRETPKPTRTSPRKAKADEDEAPRAVDKEIEMEDAPPTVPLPSASRSVGPSQAAARSKEIKRPIKPSKEAQTRTRQAPTVIRVNTGSLHSQYHPSSRVSAVSHESASSSSTQSQHQSVSKSSKASLHGKPSTQGLRHAMSVSRPKVLDLAAKKKEQDEREAQRRREAKAEMERKRAAAQEEQRKQEQQRRQEAERQKQQQERELSSSQTDSKTAAQRKAAIEKAKQTRAPPPAVRPPSRMTSNLQRSQDETSRPVNAVLSNAGKTGTKRALGPERDEHQTAKRAPSRGGPAYQATEAKRRRTSEGFDGDGETGHTRNIKGPPVRPSGGYMKDMPAKSLYGYTNAPPSATRDLFKATVTAQHNSHIKAAHPLDMAQISKGAIPFAPSAPATGSFKTPARAGAYTANTAKSTAKAAPRSSPRFQNGESIELPEIETDDDDEDEDESHGLVAAWADSPDLRRALMRQETMDPSQVFGPPAPLNMEEVFSKSKDKWHKFRARTSSANWSGADRLTEEDIRKDLAARDKLRREGGWSYDMSRELL